MSKISKSNLFRYLNILGLGFIVALVVGYFNVQQNAGPRIENAVEVPRLFDRQFARVETKRRAEQLPILSFLNSKGVPVNWNAYSGEYLLVNFWATWCAPCVLELPSLGKLAERYDDKGLQVIAISLDTQRDHEQIQEFLLNRGIGDFASHLDHKNDIQRTIRMRGIPTSFLLDAKGNLLYIFEGDADWVSPPAISFFNELLGQN